MSSVVTSGLVVTDTSADAVASTDVAGAILVTSAKGGTDATTLPVACSKAVTAIPVASANAASAISSQSFLKAHPDSSVLVGTPAVVTSSTVEAPGATMITLASAIMVDLQSPNVDNSSALRPLDPIPPPPPLTTVATSSKQRKCSRLEEQGQQEEKAITMSAAMPQSAKQLRTLAPSNSRSHPRPTRHRPKGQGAAARRKEKRRVANATGMSPVFRSTLRPQATPFVPCSFATHTSR